MKVLYTKTIEETIEFGEKLGSLLFPGAVVTLNGDLGAGKTTFTKGIAKALGVERVVSSPTFTIMKMYEGKYPLYHMDVYRLEGIGYDYDLEEYIYGDGVCVIEWSENIKDSIEDFLRIDITITDGKRQFEITDESGKYKEIMETI
jgi:tRNA threonylcarbamoyladenosine biosynthesis protein TsaE